MFPAGFPSPVATTPKQNMVVLSVTQKWTAPPGVYSAEVALVDGGTSGQFSTGGAANDYRDGGRGGDGGVHILSITPGQVYSANVGAGGAVTTSQAPGGASSFTGPNINATTANAPYKVPGGRGDRWGGSGGGRGGGSMCAPGGSNGYGAGGDGGDASAPDGTNGGGKNGVIIIRY